MSLAQEINRIANRIRKVLEDANIKLASVATDALGASGRAMLEALLAGEQDSTQLAEMSRGLLRNKIPELRLALQGRVTEHHRFLLRQLYDHLCFTESKRKRSRGAWALFSMYQRIAARRGAKRAIIAVAHALLVIAFHTLKRKENNQELGADHFDRIDVNRLRRSLVRRLERLGHRVTLEPLAQTA